MILKGYPLKSIFANKIDRASPFGYVETTKTAIQLCPLQRLQIKGIHYFYPKEPKAASQIS